MVQAADHVEHGVLAQTEPEPLNRPLTTSELLVSKARDIQRKACDEIEKMFLLNLHEIAKTRPTVWPNEFIELTPERSIYPKGTLSDDLTTARSAGFFDNDDTSGGDGSRSLQHVPSDEALVTAEAPTEPLSAPSVSYSHREPMAIHMSDMSDLHKSAPCPESFKTSPMSRTPASTRTGRRVTSPANQLTSVNTAQGYSPVPRRNPRTPSPYPRSALPRTASTSGLGQSPVVKRGLEASFATRPSLGPRTAREASSVHTGLGRSPVPNKGPSSTRTGRRLSGQEFSVHSALPHSIVTSKVPSTTKTAVSPGPQTGRAVSSKLEEPAQFNIAKVSLSEYLFGSPANEAPTVPMENINPVEGTMRTGREGKSERSLGTARQPSTTRTGRSSNVLIGRSPSTITGREIARRSDDQPFRTGRALIPGSSVHTARAQPSLIRHERPSNAHVIPAPIVLPKTSTSTVTAREKTHRSDEQGIASFSSLQGSYPFPTRTRRSTSPKTGRQKSTNSRTALERSPDVRTAFPIGPICDDCLRSPLFTAREGPSEVRTGLESPSFMTRTARLKDDERSDGLRTGKYGSVESPVVRRVGSQPKVEEVDAECPMCHRAFVVQKEVQEEDTIVRRGRVRVEDIDPKALIAKRVQSASNLTTARANTSRDSSASSFRSTDSNSSMYYSGASNVNSSALSVGSDFLEDDELTVTVNVLVVAPTSKGHRLRRLTKVFNGDISLKKAIKVLAKEIYPNLRLRLNQIYFENGDITTTRGRLQSVYLNVVGHKPLSACAGSKGIKLVLDFAGAFD